MFASTTAGLWTAGSPSRSAEELICLIGSLIHKQRHANLRREASPEIAPIISTPRIVSKTQNQCVGTERIKHCSWIEVWMPQPNIISYPSENLSCNYG